MKRNVKKDTVRSVRLVSASNLHIKTSTASDRKDDITFFTSNKLPKELYQEEKIYLEIFLMNSD